MANDLSRFPLILLAGGKSSRAGTPKGLMQVDGQPWVIHQIDAFRRAGGQKVFLVLGYQSEAYESIHAPALEKVMNPDPEHGPFSSIQAGARAALKHGCDGAFVLPVDVPAAEPRVWVELLAGLKPGVRICQPIHPRDGRERGGHPALISMEELQFLVTLASSKRLDARIHELGPHELARIRVEDPNILENLNSPEDWKNFSSPAHQ